MHTRGGSGDDGVDSPQNLNTFLLPLGLKCKRRLWNTIKKKKLLQDFISSPVVRTLYFHCRAMGLIPGQGTKIPHATRHSQKYFFRKKSYSAIIYCESCSVVSDSLQPHVRHSPWNSPGQYTGVSSLSILQGIFQPKDQTQVSCIAGGFFTS